MTATPATPVSNGTGLVAIPGHKGNLPSAIILPNGQIIPVVGNQVPSAVNTSGNNQVQSSTSSNSSCKYHSQEGNVDMALLCVFIIPMSNKPLFYV